MKKYILLLIFSIGSFLTAQETKHTVETKETLYGLSKKYKVSIEDLKDANPQLNERTPQIGEILIIPSETSKNNKITQTEDMTNKDKKKKKDKKNKKENQTNISEPSKNNPEYITIIVQPKETLFGLSKKYGTSVETIRKLNPSMDENNPKIGEILKIPNTIGVYETISEAPEISRQEEKNTSEEKEGINVVFFLPFNAEAPKSDREREIATHFYSGAQIALDSLYKQGKNINVQLIDSKNNFENTTNTFDYSNTNLIIGPLFRSDLISLADKIKRTNIPIVSPFTSSDDLDDFENLILYDTKEQILAEKLMEEVMKHYKNEKIFITHDDNSYKIAEHFKNYILEKRKNAEIRVSNNPEDITVENSSPDNKIFSVVVSNNDVFLGKYLDKIIGINSDKIHPVSLFYSPLFDNKKYEAKLLNFGLIYSDNKYVNEEGVNEAKTISNYKIKFCYSPDKYAVIGFDVTYDILNRINKQGKLTDYAMKEETKQLSNIYYFKKTNKKGAWTNQGTRIIQLTK